VDNGVRNIYTAMLSDSLVSIGSTAKGCSIHGGSSKNVTIAAGALATNLIGHGYGANSGTLVDSSAAGETTKIGVYNITGGIKDPDTYANYINSTWTTVPVGLTESNPGNTVFTGCKYRRIGNIVFFAIRLHTTVGTTTANTATSFTLPVSCPNGGSCTVTNNNTGVTVGTGAIFGGAANMPAWTTQAEVTISGTYFTD
jgi:hypothetical protein